MANIDTPKGLVPVRKVSGEPYSGAGNTYSVAAGDGNGLEATRQVAYCLGVRLYRYAPSYRFPELGVRSPGRSPSASLIPISAIA